VLLSAESSVVAAEADVVAVVLTVVAVDDIVVDIPVASADSVPNRLDRKSVV
jgi:hypothetical protein